MRPNHLRKDFCSIAVISDRVMDRFIYSEPRMRQGLKYHLPPPVTAPNPARLGAVTLSEAGFPVSRNGGMSHKSGRK
jgi:hypothetical protein